MVEMDMTMAVVAFGGTRSCSGERVLIEVVQARNDLTQEELAPLVGVRRETIVSRERGKYDPSLRLAHDIANTLDSSNEELFIFED